MKILNNEKQEIIRLTIKTEKETEYLNLIETTHEETFKYLINLFKEYSFKKGNRTTIDTRYCLGSINGKSQRISLYGISAKGIKEKITTDLRHKNLTK